jgi:pSer/pThr/pTyr-binding forkhead associated (FHA) protein
MGFGSDPIPGMDLPFDVAPSQSSLRPDTALLRILNGPAAGRAYPLNAVRLRIGRNDPPNHLVDIDLTDCELGDPPKVSRRHAELRWVDETLQILDLGSSNGTDVNGERLVAVSNPASFPVALRPGDRIRFANLECEIALQEE